VEEVPGGAIVSVNTDEAARLVTVAAAGDPSLRAELVAQQGGPQDSLRFAGFIALPPGVQALRVVVADTARNESDQTITVQVSGQAIDH